MINLVKHNNNSRRVTVDEYSLLIVAHTNELNNEQLEYVNGFIIDTDNTKFAKDIIYQIRNNDDLNIALLPIFISAVVNLPQDLEIHTDGVFSMNMIDSYTPTISKISKRIHKLQVPKTANYQEFINFKILAFCYSRNKVLAPITSRHSLIGYIYPMASLMFKNSEAMTLLKTLDHLSQQKLLSFSLEDYVHLCKSCSGNYINFRECCPKCNSINIKAYDMIHHFVCAHVAPEKDFKTEDSLECPKCDKQLRHIGIDYDKPSTIYSCVDCNHEFQNSSMKAMCIDCNTEHELDELLEKAIGNYSLTQKGEDEVLGKNTSNQHSNKHIGNLSLPIFKILLNQEIQRVKTSGCSSQFVSIQITNKQLQLLNIETKNELAIEINNIIKSYLKEADILTSVSYDKHYLILPETKENDLERLNTITYNLNKLLTNNVTEDSNDITVNYEAIASNKPTHYYID